jgi:diguanylate cyclase (GGDEF)-like protein/PAS domain S-box-containing protein
MQLFQHPEIYRDILDCLQIGVSVLDLEKKIVFWSDGAEHITGYARIDVLGHPCKENIFLHCNGVHCEMCIDRCFVERALHEAHSLEAISYIHHKLGHRIPVRTWTTPLRGTFGSIVGIVQTFESQYAPAGPDPNDRSMQERGWVDEPTGLLNPAIMQSHLLETLGTFAAFKIPFSVVFVRVCELDNFRARYGQEAARSILRVLAQTLRNTVWPADHVGTWGEGQFLVILSGCPDDARKAASRRIQKMMANAAIEWWGEELSVVVSVGGTVAVEGDTMETLLQRAQPAGLVCPSLLTGRAARGGSTA